MIARTTDKQDPSTPRRVRRLALVAGFTLQVLVLSGCDQQQANAAAQVIVPALTAMASNSSNASSSNSSSSLLSSNSSSSFSNLGSSVRDASAGFSNADGSTTIPSYGANASKAQINEMLAAAARKYGIPEDILKGVAYQESGWRADAKSFDGGHGKGIMQIDDRFHAFARTNDVWDPAKNIDYGAKFLRQLYNETGAWDKALKRYNGSSSYPPLVMAHAQKKPWQAWV